MAEAEQQSAVHGQQTLKPPNLSLKPPNLSRRPITLALKPTNLSPKLTNAPFDDSCGDRPFSTRARIDWATREDRSR